MATRTTKDLVGAYLEFRRYQGKHPDLAGFHERRYRAFSAILGMDLSQPPTANEDGHGRTGLHHVFDGVTRFYLGISTPFAGYLEAPAELVKLAAPYQEQFESLAETQQKLCLDLLCDLAEAIYGPCEREVGEDELEGLGVGASQAPDPDEYF